MKTIKFIEFAHALTKTEIAHEIFDTVMKAEPVNNVVTIDMSGVVTMTTQCAKIIFGMLYVSIGSEAYHKNVNIINSNEVLDLVIEFGIEHALRNAR